MDLSANDTSSQNDGFVIRNATESDASEIWKLVEDSHTLDHNSFYCYFLLCHFFGSTCMVAYEHDELIGFLTGFLLPEQQNTYFIWQVRVIEKKRGLGLAQRLTRFILTAHENEIEYIEATVAPHNLASQGFLNSIASQYKCTIMIDDHFLPASCFPGLSKIHEQENLFRIGPLMYQDR